MGAWGTGLYQNDTSMDVKSEYVMLLKQGKSDEEALQEILDAYAYDMEEEDDKYDVCFALADTMWKYGRLANEVKERALNLIEEGGDEKRWTEAKEKERQKRKQVVENLREQLLSEMPKRKRVSVHKPYITKWKPQEVYLYQIKNPPEGKEEYLGWYIIIYVQEIKEQEFVVRGVKDMMPDVYLKLSKEKPKEISEINNASFMCLSRNPQIGSGYFRTIFCEVSNRNYPKDLEFFGLCNNFLYPEFEEHASEARGGVQWIALERKAIIWYENELTRLAEIEERKK